MVSEQLKKHLSERSTWLRGLYMLLFAFIYSVAEVVMIAVAIFQWLAKLVTGRANARLLEFSRGLCLFMYQIWQFLTFTSEELPFPFAPWPDGSRPQDLLRSPPGGPPSNFV